MDQNSLRLKVVRLAQRSRRAIRLYTSVHHNSAYTNYSSASSSSQESNLYASSALAATLKDTHHSIIDDFANSNCESHTLATASMAALSTKVSSSKSYRNSGEKFSEMQASEWREVNMSLLKALTARRIYPRELF